MLINIIYNIIYLVLKNDKLYLDGCEVGCDDGWRDGCLDGCLVGCEVGFAHVIKVK